MHILVGAVIGAVCAVAWSVVFARATRRPITARRLLLVALGGAIGGGVAAATLGAAGLGAAGAGRQVLAFAGGGAVGTTVERATDNVTSGQPVTEGLGKAATLGAATGAVSLGVIRGAGAGLGQVRGVPIETPRVVNAQVSGTNGAVRRTFVDPPPEYREQQQERERQQRERQATQERDASAAAAGSTSTGAPPPPAGRGFIDRLDF